MSDQFNDLINGLSKASKKDGQFKVYKPGDMFFGSNVPYSIRTGLPELDLAFEGPGWAAGRVAELYGFEGGGKTSLGMHAIAECQKMGGIGVFVDIEKTLWKRRAESIGINLDKNFITIDANSPDAATRALLEFGDTVLSTKINAPIVAVVDSIVGKLDELTQEKAVGEEARVGQTARVLRNVLPRIAEVASNTKMSILLINHAIETASSYGVQSKAAGGHAIKLWATHRVEISTGQGKGNQIWTGEKRIGQFVNMKVLKNKVGALPYPNIKKSELLDVGGFNTKLSLLRAMIKVGFVRRKGTTTQYFLKGSEEEIPFDIVEGSRDYTQWYNLIEKMGGIDEAYTRFIDKCIAEGHMYTYG
jgi:recombination protein RecA